MHRSIRWRLQLWYAVVLVLTVGGLAGFLYHRVRVAQFQRVDAQLEAAALYLDVNLRRVPGRELLDAGLPVPSVSGGPPPFQANQFGEPPPREGRPVRLLNDLGLPVSPDAAAEPADNAVDRTYFAIWRPDGAVLRASELPEGVTLPNAAGLVAPPRPRLSRRGNLREAIMLGPQHTAILVGRSITIEQAELRAFAWQLVAAGVVVVAAGLAGGWLISARILKPVAAISATASSISASNLSQRIDVEKVDRELADLARVLNRTFDRLERDFERQARFTADASHELRTPLAVVQTSVELALSRPRSAEQYVETLRTCLQASTRMRALVDGLLTLARADANRLELTQTTIDLAALAHEAVDQYSDEAARSAIQLSVESVDDPVVIQGDAAFMRRLLDNLVSNSLRYTPAGGEVRVTVAADAASAVISVADTGCGIAEGDLPHIFDRFYRADEARSRATGGCGLGLAIAKGIVEAHGGAIRCTSQAGQGATFTVSLPLVPRRDACSPAPMVVIT
jgi:heavy metal sensor kinase